MLKNICLADSHPKLRHVISLLTVQYLWRQCRILVMAGGLTCSAVCGILVLHRNWTSAPCTARWILNHWTTWEVPPPKHFKRLTYVQRHPLYKFLFIKSKVSWQKRKSSSGRRERQASSMTARRDTSALWWDEVLLYLFAPKETCGSSYTQIQHMRGNPDHIDPNCHHQGRWSETTRDKRTCTFINQ